MRHPSRRRLGALALALAAVAASACADEDAIDQACERLVGDVQVVVDSVYASGVGLRVGDSVQVGTSVRRIDAARAVLLGGNFTECEATYGDPLDRPVTFASSSDAIVAVRQNGWVIGNGAGFAAVTVTSDADVEPAQFFVQVAP